MSLCSIEKAAYFYKLIIKGDKLQKHPRIEGCLAFDSAGVAMFGMTAAAMAVLESTEVGVEVIEARIKTLNSMKFLFKGDVKRDGDKEGSFRLFINDAKEIAE